MLTQLYYNIDLTLLQEAIESMPNFEKRISLNSQSSNFFYDPWLIRPEFKNTVWEKILQTLPMNIGEARLMKLQPEECYRSHADMDDRYHLSITGNNSYLIDLDANKMYPTNADLYWYEMNAGKRHSAVNFGNQVRIQLVIRKLLQRGILKNPVDVSIEVIKEMINYRYIFDDVFSPWLNEKNKQGLITDFNFDTTVTFKTEDYLVQELVTMCPTGFNIK
jgi:hypothetical protein